MSSSVGSGLKLNVPAAAAPFPLASPCISPPGLDMLRNPLQPAPHGSPRHAWSPPGPLTNHERARLLHGGVPEEKPITYVEFAAARPLPGLDQSEGASSLHSFASARGFFRLGRPLYQFDLADTAEQADLEDLEGQAE